MEIPVLSNLHHLPFTPNKTPARDSRHWNSVIKHHTSLKNDNAILSTYTQMEAIGILPDDTTLPLVLKACARLQDVEKGKRIHNQIQNTDLIDDIRIRTALVDFYCKCGLLVDARYVFDEMRERDVVAWNAMISGCVGCCEYESAVLLLAEMQKEGLRANSVAVVALLLACGELLNLRYGKEIHGYCLRNGLFHLNHHVGTALIGFYLKFDVRISCLVFRLMASKNIVSWNVMISGYFDVGDYVKALELFVLMLMEGFECNLVTMLVVVQACTGYKSSHLGMQVHQMAIKFGFCRDLYIVNALLNMYSESGLLKSACDLFESMLPKDVPLYNSMISAYLEYGLVEEALSLFSEMQFTGFKYDARTVAILFPLCAELRNGLKNGSSLHAYVIKGGMKRNPHIENALLSMYADLDCVEDVMRVFSEMSVADVISWNTLIMALAKNNLSGQAWDIFRKMQVSKISPNSHTIISILAPCEDESFLAIGKSIHGYAIKHCIEIDPSLNTALTEMYMKCGDEVTAVKLFERYHDKDLISWNSLISSYINRNQVEKALLIFECMISEIEPNSVTITNVLSLCSNLANLPLGRCLHAYAIRRQSSLGFDLPLANSLITMYARCGSMCCAEYIFESLPRKNIVTWNALIASYGMHGRGHDAMLAFSKMLEDGFEPNSVTFVSALSACSHSGLVKKGLQLFESMVQDFKIMPEVVHYSCVVDLLCRGGSLNEARKFIGSMHIAPDASVWRALLSGCRVYSETKLAKTIFDKLVELEPTNAGNYVLLSNIYAAAGLWSEVRKSRAVIEEKGLKKPPGKSWIAVRSEIHYFTAGDRSHPQSDKIYSKLSSLVSSLRENGYVPDIRWILHDEEDEEKLKRLLSHSEKLAISFGLINVSRGTAISITKNLRVCGDCHEFGKHVSKLVRREIVLRDGSRFHHFSNGFCSCKDYW